MDKPDTLPTECFPDFGNNTLVNLMSRLGRAAGAPTPYAELAHPALADIETGNHIVLLVIDGLGVAQLEALDSAPTLSRHLAGSIRSVFPATTSTAITSLMTGETPAMHGLTGWHTYCADTGQIVMPLPLGVRHPHPPLETDPAVLAGALYAAPSLFSRMTRAATVHQPVFLAHSPYSLHHSGTARRVPWKTLRDLVDHLLEACRTAEPGFHYAYIPQLDTVMHEHGPASSEARDCLAAIDTAFAALAAGKPAGATLIVTADHGFVDAPPERRIDIAAYPELAGELRLPLSGEPRAVFCHVREGRADAFLHAARERLGHAAWCVPSGELMRAGVFGPGEPHPRLASRIGDVTLLLREEWTLGDTLPHEKPYRLRGMHGGISDAETRIPLIVA
ncbi:alkaline phosphatase family protein [Paludibacterium paludis]|uniref:Alkaline phosphatase family protein n=1 Tax=Paludibacterium paludis TaxID=1225769 RepID=A0A918P527_9NEIS|nr:alkaline phosphatase family protein [Paludibacterium paludis]GGY24042.1 alkaline phosphatase family protein [Paludibacterium paludis]